MKLLIIPSKNAKLIIIPIRDAMIMSCFPKGRCTLIFELLLFMCIY